MKKAFWMAATLLLAACGEKIPPSDKIDTGLRVVKVMTVGDGGTKSQATYSGEIRARHETQLAFRVGGKIIERLVETGQHVAAGQPLARLDPTDLTLAAAQAEANHRLAQAELARTRELRQKNFISQAVLDAKEAAARQAEAQVRLAKNQIGYATLYADHAGVITAVLAEAGQVVTSGQAIFRLARDGEREVAINLPEAALSRLKIGAGGTARLWSADVSAEQTYRAVLREIAPAADPATRTFAARVALIDAPANLPLGLTASVSFEQSEAPPTVVPLSAIIQQGDRPAVWVVAADDTVSLRPITIARYSDAGAVVSEGLTAGETIVAAGAFRLVAGEKVRRAEP